MYFHSLRQHWSKGLKASNPINVSIPQASITEFQRQRIFFSFTAQKHIRWMILLSHNNLHLLHLTTKDGARK